MQWLVVLIAVLLALPTLLRLASDMKGYHDKVYVVKDAKEHGRTAWASVVWSDTSSEDDIRCVYEFSHFGKTYQVERDWYLDEVQVYWPDGNPDGAVFEPDVEFAVVRIIAAITGAIVFIGMDFFLACMICRAFWG